MPTIDNLHDLSNTVTAVVNRILEVVTQNTSSGQYYVDYSDVSDLICEEDFLHYFDLITYELRGREEVLDLDTADHEFDVVCGLAWCPNYELLPDEDLEFGDETLRPAISMARLSEIGQKAIEHLVLQDQQAKFSPEDLGISQEEVEYVRNSFPLQHSEYQDPTILTALADKPVTNQSYEDLIIASDQQRLQQIATGVPSQEKPVFQVCVNIFGQELDDRDFPRDPDAMSVLRNVMSAPAPTATPRYGATICGRPALILYQELPEHIPDPHLRRAAAAMMSAQLQSIFLCTTARITYHPGTGEDGRAEIMAILPADAPIEKLHAFERSFLKAFENLPFSRDPNWVKAQYDALFNAAQEALPRQRIITPWIQVHPEQAALRACEALGKYIGNHQPDFGQACITHNYEKKSKLASKFDVSNGSPLLSSLVTRGINRADFELGRRVQLFTTTDLKESFTLSKGQLLQAMKDLGYSNTSIMDFMSGYSPETAKEIQSIFQPLARPALSQQIHSAEERKNHHTDPGNGPDRASKEGRDI